MTRTSPRRKADSPPSSAAPKGRAEAERLLQLAQKSRSKQKRLSLAHQALAVWPDCAQAYKVLWDTYESDPQLSVALLRLAVQAAQRAIGEQRLTALWGRYASDPDAFELLRFEASLALMARATDLLDEAIAWAEAVVHHDGRDPLHMRFIWVSCLLEAQDPERTIKAYGVVQDGLDLKDAHTDWWLFYRALVLFQLNGDNRRSREALAAALARGPMLAAALLSDAAVMLAEAVGLDLDADALVEFVNIARPAWLATPGAEEWLSDQLDVFKESLEDDRPDPWKVPVSTRKKRSPKRDPRETADVLAHMALMAESPDERKRLLEKALAESDDSPVSYYLSALIEKVPARKLEFYTLARQASQRVWGDHLRKRKGDLWKDPAGRNHLLALAGVAYYQWHLGSRADAIVTYEELLSLDPSDPLHVLALLLVCYLEERTRRDAQVVRDRSDAKITADEDAGQESRDSSLSYNYALSLIQIGASDDAAEQEILGALDDAISENPYIPPLLLGDWEMPRALPSAWTYGEYTEAIDYVSYAKNAWSMTPGALDVLRELVSRGELPNEPDFVEVDKHPTRLSTIREYLGVE